MALLNIGAGNKDDAFYRYKMPRLNTKVEGRGNGIKTNIVNMVDVAKALARPPSYTTKFFGNELGAQSKFDEKTGTAIVNGSHDTPKLAGLLENFIKKYVQCYGCGNPETDIIITKSELINLKCAACGFVSDVDMRDKLTTFIVRNPPEQKKKGSDKKGMRRAEKERMKAGEAADEEMKQSKKETRKKKVHEDGNHATKKKTVGSDEEEYSPNSSQADQAEDVEEEEVEWLTDTSVAAAQLRSQEQLTAATSEMVMLNMESDESGKAAIEERNSVKKSSGKKGVLETNVEGESGIAPGKGTSLHEKLVMDFKACLANGFDASQLSAHLRLDRPNVTQQEAMNACFEALFDGVTKGLAKEAGKKKKYLSNIVTDVYSQELLLEAIEACFVNGPLEMKKEVEVAGLLKMLYDLDIVEEEAVMCWYDQGVTGSFGSEGAQVKKLATPFVEWLRNAESEDEN